MTKKSQLLSSQKQNRTICKVEAVKRQRENQMKDKGRYGDKDKKPKEDNEKKITTIQVHTATYIDINKKRLA